MLFAASLLAATLLSACESHDSRLIGRWRSNRELSIRTFPHREKLAADKRAIFDNLFGKLTLTYTQRYVETEMPSTGSEAPFRQRSAYRIISSDADSVTVAFEDAPIEGDTTKVIHFEGPNRYWIPVGISNGKEYFDRVSQ